MTTDASPSERPSAPPVSKQRLAAQLLDAADVAFLEALRKAGLLAELDDDELLRLASEVDAAGAESRKVELLELYYEIGDAERREARRGADRFFMQRVGQPATASGLVGRLSVLTPELGGIALERIGGPDGPLVLRAGDHFCAVLDENEEEMDTDQVDLSEIEGKADVPMVTVRGLVRSTNVLLDRHGIRERLISLRGDEDRELYVRLGVTEALALCRDGYLEDEEPEDVMELGAW
ncbi:MAG: hypothetical protein KF729_09220 [Sandaracinaceae bacterium]|nr:hypothetical protein [Sandaracinaceae bacterium]